MRVWAFKTLAAVDYFDVVFFSFLVLLVVLLLFVAFCVGVWLNRRQVCISPYSKLPLRRGSDLSYYSMESVLRYLYQLHQYDNRIYAYTSQPIAVKQDGYSLMLSVGTEPSRWIGDS